MKGKINLEQVKLLPRDLQIEIMANVARKPFTQSELADIQLKLQKEFSQNTEQGKRNDLGRPKNGATSETGVSQVKRTTQQIGDIFGESHKTVERRLETFSEINKHPGKYSKVKESLDNGTMKINTANKIVLRKKRSLPKVPLHVGEWDVFIADIPEKFRNEGIRGAAEHHYPTMEAKEIAELKVPAANNAVMYFYVRSSTMYEKIHVSKREGGIEFTYEIPFYQYVLDSWGFTHIAAEFVWPKDKMGLGSYNRNQHEKILMAFKGTMPTPAKMFSSVIEAERGEHSAKPKILFKMAEEMYPGRKYYEIFSREQYSDKWTCHGNQVIQFDQVMREGHTEECHKIQPESGYHYKCPKDYTDCKCPCHKKKGKPNHKLAKKEITVACADCLEVFHSKDTLKLHKQKFCKKRKGAI